MNGRIPSIRVRISGKVKVSSKSGNKLSKMKEIRIWKNGIKNTAVGVPGAVIQRITASLRDLRNKLRNNTIIAKVFIITAVVKEIINCMWPSKKFQILIMKISSPRTSISGRPMVL